MGDPKPNYSLLANLQPNKPFVIEVRIISTTRTTFYVKTNAYRIAFDVKDQEGTIGRLVAYTKPLCEKMEATFKVGNPYLIQRATLKFVEVKYRNTDIPFDIQLTPFSKITELKSEETRVPVFVTKYHTITDIADLPIGSSVNLIAFVADIGNIELVTENQTPKCQLLLEDQTSAQIHITFWGDRTNNIRQYQNHDILTIQRAKVVNYQGLSLQINSATHIQIGASTNTKTNELQKLLTERETGETTKKGVEIQDKDIQPEEKRKKDL